MNLWQIISLLVVLIYSASCLAAQNTGLNLICLIIIGCIVPLLVLLGLILQTFVPKFHSRLYRKRKDIRNIINFAFTWGERAFRYLDEHRRVQHLEANPHISSVTDLNQPQET